MGEGIAYGVYVEDTLSEAIDETTLEIGQGGLYLPVSRTILWEIGELGPQGSPTASGSVTFTAQLRAGLPGLHGHVRAGLHAIRVPRLQ